MFLLFHRHSGIVPSSGEIAFHHWVWPSMSDLIWWPEKWQHNSNSFWWLFSFSNKCFPLCSLPEVGWKWLEKDSFFSIELRKVITFVIKVVMMWPKLEFDINCWRIDVGKEPNIEGLKWVYQEEEELFEHMFSRMFRKVGGLAGSYYKLGVTGMRVGLCEVPFHTLWREASH